MRQTEFTYQQLFRVLRAFGFRRRPLNGDPPTRLFMHESGAFMTFPRFPRRERVWEYHLVMARIQLDNFGIADPTTFDAELQQAGVRHTESEHE